MTNIRVVDRTLLFLNLLLLLFVVVIRFATATMAQYLTRPARMRTSPWHCMRWYSKACRSLLRHLRVDPGRRPVAPAGAQGEKRPRLVATGMAFVNAPAALAIIGLVAVYYMVDPRPAAVRRAD